MTLTAHSFATSLGTMVSAVDEHGALAALVFCNDRTPEESIRAETAPGETIVWDCGRNAHVVAQLGEYFLGIRKTFDLPLAFRGTEFQNRVWKELCGIPYGATISYKTLAERVGSPGASRAVGRANGLNPIPVVVPCHRVIGANGTLTGYSGGLAIKEHLLKLEGAMLDL